jgi:hypothetical protein
MRSRPLDVTGELRLESPRSRLWLTGAGDTIVLVLERPAGLLDLWRLHRATRRARPPGQGSVLERAHLRLDLRLRDRTVASLGEPRGKRGRRVAWLGRDFRLRPLALLAALFSRSRKDPAAR